MPSNSSDVSALVNPQSALSSQFIHAGAGAGKTTKLIQTFLQFAKEFKLKNSRYPRVVLTTFTRKATQEVKERLLVSALSDSDDETNSATDSKNNYEIFEYINKKSQVHISTIHGLLSIYLSQNAERMKFPQDIKIIDAAQYERILRKQINALIKKNTEYLALIEQYSFLQLVELARDALNFKAQNKNFNFVQQEELSQISQQEQQAILAKIEKIFSLISSGANNAEKPLSDTWINYFDFLKNISQALKQHDENSFFELLEYTPAKPRWSNSTPPFDPVAHALIEELKNKDLVELFDSQEYIQKHQSLNQLFFQLINELFDSLNLYKRNTGELTIADLENLSLQLLELHPDTGVDFSNSWDYFMIDEYQDTSPLQVRILDQIIRDKPCFIVGDPQQSIYLFRGARSEVFTEKLNVMRSKNAKIHFLDINYRSEPSLMNFINQYFLYFSPQFKPMQPKPQIKKLSSEICDKKTLTTLNQDAFYIKGKNQVDAVLNHILFLLNCGVNPQDICVLSKSNSKLMDIAVKANKVSIPVQLQAATGFEEKREVIDLIAFNKFLNNPHDDENLVTLVRSPWFYMTDTDILTLSHSPLGRSHSLWTALLNLSLNLGSVENSTQQHRDCLIKYLELFDTAGAMHATKQFITESSFVSFSQFYDKTGKREANIFKFLISLAQAEKSLGFSLGLFLEEQFQSLQADLSSGSAEAQPVVQPDCVSLMTVHAAKGLQFKHVIIIGFSDLPTLSKIAKISFDDVTEKFSLAVLDENTSKHQASGWAFSVKEKFNQRELLENERVLYVAMTRAIESVSLIAEIGESEPNPKSWYKRSNWPVEFGDIVHVDPAAYRATSLNYADLELPQAVDIQVSHKARNKFSLQRTEEQSAEVTGDSVTDLIAGGSNKNSQEINYESTLANLKLAQKGSDLHRIFESLKYRNPEELVKNLNQADQQSVKFLLLQKDLDLKSLLKHGHNEWGFALKTKSKKTKLIKGQIDLWCELENEIHVLDYKTGSSRYSDKAFEQLAFYTMALSAMQMIASNKKIIHSVVYPVEGLIKQKSFIDFNNFQSTLSIEMKELFL